jgi:FkbM family methyltransferase
MNTAYRLKSTASRVAKNLGYKIERQLPEFSRPLDLLALALKSKGCLEDCHFIQIGANDGETDDPIFNYILKSDSRWHGVLIEPQPSAFLSLSQKYCGNNRVHLENSAINSIDGVCDFYVSKDHDLLAGLSSKSLKNRLSRTTPIDVIQVNCISPRSLCNKYDISSLDLLVVDTEGFDAEAVMLMVSTDLLPEIILFEHVNVPKVKLRECFSDLEARNYKLIRYGIDVIAIHNAA